MDVNKSVATVSISTWDLLLVAFIVLKLCGVIKWSWIWVLCPLWIPALIVVVVLVVYAIYNKVSEKKRKKEYWF